MTTLDVTAVLSSVVAQAKGVTPVLTEAAEKGGLALAGFIRGDRMNIYTHPERISD